MTAQDEVNRMQSHMIPFSLHVKGEHEQRPVEGCVGCDRNLLEAEVDRLQRQLCGDAMYQHAYFAIQRLMDEALGPNEEDGAGAGLQEDVALVVDQRDEALELLAELMDPDPCSFDHHGYCQAHGWLQEGECAVARAQRLLAARQSAGEEVGANG